MGASEPEDLPDEIPKEPLALLGYIATALQGLVGAQRRIARSLRHINLRHAISTIVNLATVAVMIWLLVAGLHQSADNGKALKTASEVLREVRSCTQPGGTCYARSQRQQAAAVTQIIRSICLVVFPGQPDRVDRCVTRALTPPSEGSP